jgi:hypothetical protein
MNFRPFLHCFAAVCLVSCGETFPEVVARHQVEFDDFKLQLANIASAVPAEPKEIQLTKPLDPLPKFVSSNLAESNIAICPLEQLTNPEAKLSEETQLDFYDNSLKNPLIWATWVDQKAFDNFENDLKAAFAIRYIAVYRTLTLVKPTMIDDKTYDRGGVLMEVMVYDRTARAFVCAFTISAQAKEEVSFQYELGSSAVEAGLKTARSSLWENAQNAFFEALAQKTGGSFE